MSSPKDFHIDAVYPEHLSRLRRNQGPNEFSIPSSIHRRAVKKQLHRGGSGRFRTQPVTFHEIKEVDEDNITEPETTGSAGTICKSETDLKAKFEVFYRSINVVNCSDPNSNNISRLPPSNLTITSISSSSQYSPAPDESASEDEVPACPPSTCIIATTALAEVPTPPVHVPIHVAFNQNSRPSI